MQSLGAPRCSCCQRAAAGSPRSAGDSHSCSRPKGRPHACQQLQQHECGKKDEERGSVCVCVCVCVVCVCVCVCVCVYRLTWWSIRWSAAQRLATFCIQPHSVVLVKMDVREVKDLAHWRTRLCGSGQHSGSRNDCTSYHIQSDCMCVCTHLWWRHWHHWWLWGGGQLHRPCLVPGVVGITAGGAQ